MALNGNTEGSAMKTATDATLPAAGTPVTSGQLLAWWQALGTANVTHFTGNAQVIVTSVTGVLSGGATSGPGTGTLT